MARHGRSTLASRAVALQRSQCFATAAAQKTGGDDDIVLDTFKEQQQQYRALLDGSKNLVPPLDGDKAAIKKYATDMENLRKKVGLPDHVETVEALLGYKLQVARGDVQAFLASALEGQELPDDLAGIVGEVEAALDSADKGGKGWGEFTKKIQDIQNKHKLSSYDKIKDEAITEMYTNQLSALRAKVSEDMEVVKRRDHLDFVNVDPSELKVTSIA